MDAKVGDWVVTPRRGKAVEINALWYNASPHGKLGSRRDRRGRGRQSNVEPRTAVPTNLSTSGSGMTPGGLSLRCHRRGRWPGLSSLRPNQLFSFSSLVSHSRTDPCGSKSWNVRQQTTCHTLRIAQPCPRLLRTTSPSYYGDLRSRDAAYHQGTVWGWLIGPFIDAWLRVYPDDSRGCALDSCVAFQPHLGRRVIGSISEVFDADDPFMPSRLRCTGLECR